jgi:hypothetical protein
MMHDSADNQPTYRWHHDPRTEDHPPGVYVSVVMDGYSEVCFSGTPAMLRQFVANLTAAVEQAIAEASGDWGTADAIAATTDVYRPETAAADTAEVPS